ncbi:Folic acid synthesis protein fol1 [Cyphellophora attinorum]|uniref:Folic acid synthesis protein FOL1 n=1 Tax=Cyphellophora attinorum TaxID=1664694 RepID=A0A0N1NW60_9EURO|nr:Folic acid synthesis protein fol1 [Phialophora attinorum]KPI35436.1 Folic acid synthesis protein fol1 [Phialophora attinorum]
MGNRIANIEAALHEMRQRFAIRKVSPLYETKPMYYEDQGSFINGACEVETDLDPISLLDALQSIEDGLGRQHTINKGPRPIDLDVLLYNKQQFQHERLEIPHKLMHEREFVLRPLKDILPYAVVNSSALQHPSTVMDLYIGLKNRDETMSPVTEVSHRLPLIRSMDPKRPTSIMAILNITPDSFSDGGKFSSRDQKALKPNIGKIIAAGATILDVGGQSTRPHAKLISAEEELERILPVVRTIRKMPEADGVAISVDTFYSEVAKGAIAEGADLINDISAGQMDPNMLSTVANLSKTIVLMHMRGDPSTMTKLTDYPHGVVERVAQELSLRFQAALDAGIAPWRIILDPGIGFAKNQDQNLELLRRLRELREHPVNLSGPPWLLGTSRKGFVGKVTGVADAAARQFGTAATVTASIAGGADIVRVHDVKEMAEVVKMADAIYR